ncbi:glycosyltransferase family 2 protein [Mycoplasmopsis bovigenitalium]|uniref:glycosyltransferase n=1 Tax=Mycoplasmopsis bovigenitalium TaxID=2112 RepID=UPI0003A13594|nr:glycosyltransferase family 2 protein [Mycoplasmopsis bovigenitalium]
MQQTNFWDFNSLSHDIEFSQWLLINDIKTNYAENAIFYDEQPIVYKDSIKQRTRWSVGFNQVFKMYGGSVFCSLFKPKRSKFSAYSNYLMIFPAVITFLTNILLYLITSSLYLASFLLIKKNGLEHVYSEFNIVSTLIYILSTPLIILFTIWINLFLQGIFVVVKNKKRIKANKWQKFISILAYPTFMLTYIPISLKALFIKKFSTKPIQRKAR